MILVTGAAGKTGRYVIQELIEKGARIRAFVHHKEYIERVEEIGAVEAIHGDLHDRRTMDQAVEGIRAVYHIPPNVHPDEVAIGKTVISAAQSAEIELFVYHSVAHPHIEAMPHHWQKMRVEEQLFSCGLAFTILQPAAYMQNILAQWDTLIGDGCYRVPYPLETQLSLVDLKDVAEAAGLVLTEDGHTGATYELIGTKPMSQIEVAQTLSDGLGRDVTVERIAIEVWEQGARDAGLGTYAIETLTQMFLYYEHHDFVGSPQ
ncbi:MAG: NmrA family NAD(P)-binding protein, partial [Chloroflexi bacterium]|nr:NmrA family NAD(P)-binding protein [Chloroflexota bacterium]